MCGMTALKTIGVACLMAVTVAAWQQTPRVRPEDVGLSSVRLREATDFLNRYVAEQRIAGAVAAVARRGRVGYLEAVGVQDLQTRVPMTERSLFRIYSMTRPVTAVAVMMLHEAAPLQPRRSRLQIHPRVQERRRLDSPGAAPRAAGETHHRARPSASHFWV